MDAAQALAELTAVSAQIREAALLGSEGETLAGSDALARAARELLEAARDVRAGAGVTQIEASTAAGSLFVVRDGERVVAAVTEPEPTVGLVFYDLRAALRSAAEDDAPPAPKARRRRAKPTDEENADGEA
jgi:hypothetical protein